MSFFCERTCPHACAYIFPTQNPCKSEVRIKPNREHSSNERENVRMGGGWPLIFLFLTIDSMMGNILTSFADHLTSVLVAAVSVGVSLSKGFSLFVHCSPSQLCYFSHGTRDDGRKIFPVPARHADDMRQFQKDEVVLHVNGQNTTLKQKKSKNEKSTHSVLSQNPYPPTRIGPSLRCVANFPSCGSYNLFSY